MKLLLEIKDNKAAFFMELLKPESTSKDLSVFPHGRHALQHPVVFQTEFQTLELRHGPVKQAEAASQNELAC